MPNTAEDIFLSLYRKKGVAAYDSLLTEASWLNMNRHAPATDAGRFRALIRQMPSAPQFLPVGSYLSAGKDLAYVYGDLVYDSRRAHYLRIWGHTAGAGGSLCR